VKGLVNNAILAKVNRKKKTHFLRIDLTLAEESSRESKQDSTFLNIINKTLDQRIMMIKSLKNCILKPQKYYILLFYFRRNVKDLFY
jgi:hypothetical protein